MWMRCLGLRPLWNSYLQHLFDQITSSPEDIEQHFIDSIYQSQPRIVKEFLETRAKKEPDVMSKTATEFLKLINTAE